MRIGREPGTENVRSAVSSDDRSETSDGPSSSEMSYVTWERGKWQRVSLLVYEPAREDEAGGVWRDAGGKGAVEKAEWPTTRFDLSRPRYSSLEPSRTSWSQSSATASRASRFSSDWSVEGGKG